jgi:hypothetical protein
MVVMKIVINYYLTFHFPNPVTGDGQPMILRNSTSEDLATSGGLTGEVFYVCPGGDSS